MAEHNLAVRGFAGFVARAGNLQSFILLVCRLAWGWQMYVSGNSHLHDVPPMVARFTSWHVPFPTMSVYVSGVTEMVGGLLLMAGLGTRIISVPLVFNFLVAIGTAGASNVQQLVNGGQILDPKTYPGRLGAVQAIMDDTAFPFLIISLVLFAFGPGKASIDYFIKRLVFPERVAEKAPPT